MNDLLTISATEIARRIRDKQLTSHEAVLAHDAQVARDPRPARLKLRRELARAALPVGEQLDDPPPRRVGEGRQRIHCPSSRARRVSALVQREV